MREVLPARRACETVTVEVDGQRYTVAVGRYDDGRAAEVFVSATRQGSALDVLLADASVVISLALKNGLAAADLAKSVARLPIGGLFSRATAPASPIGAVLDLLARPWP